MSSSWQGLNYRYAHEDIGRDAEKWLKVAKRLKMSADLILLHLSMEQSPEQHPSEKGIAYLEAYMMLTGFAFENLIKGVDVAKNPNLALKDIHKNLWKERKGHGISTFAQRIATLSQEEIYLFKRLEEFVYWAGRYPIPISPNDFSNSIGSYLIGYSSGDPPMVDRLFEQFSNILVEEK